jgi:nicotinate-nucleotide adenylyltransferase
MNKYIIFGGAFDPIHKGHIQRAWDAWQYTDYDKVLIIPAYKHIWDKEMASYKDRFNMIKLALNDMKINKSFVNVNRFAAIFDRPLSTYDLLQALFEDEGDVNPDSTACLIGTDQANQIEKWQNWEQLIKLVPFIVMNRGGTMPTVDWYLQPPHKFIKVQPDFTSSTEVRQKIKEGKDVSRYLTPSVIKYIKDNKLYV